jgi:hypothetical protein
MINRRPWLTTKAVPEPYPRRNRDFPGKMPGAPADPATSARKRRRHQIRVLRSLYRQLPFDALPLISSLFHMRLLLLSWLVSFSPTTHKTADLMPRIDTTQLVSW